MTTEQREKLLDYNEALCREYNETENSAVLEKIAATEFILFHTQPISSEPLEIEKES